MFSSTKTRARASIIGTVLGMALTAGPMVATAFGADNDPLPASKNCQLVLPGEGLQWLPPRTTITVTLDDGTKKKCECRDGEWVSVERTLALSAITVPLSALAIRR